jgi:hypothetical protein
VSIGPSTILSVLVAVSLVLTMLFGQDWGLATNAPAIAGGAAALVTVGLTISRALQHNALAGAQAAVYAAQVSSATVVATSSGGGTSAASVVQATNQLAAAAANTDPVLEVDDSVPDDLPADTQPPAQ